MPTQPHAPASPTKRPRGTKTHVTASGCYVADSCTLEGTMTLERGCVLHPCATILVAPGASLTLGPGCVLEEKTFLVFDGPGHASVGQGNVFQVGSAVDLVPGASVGEWNTFAPRSRVRNVRVGDWCSFGAGTALREDHPQLGPDKVVPSCSVVWGDRSRISEWDGSGREQELAVRRAATEFLREILPKPKGRGEQRQPTAQARGQPGAQAQAQAQAQ